MVSIFLGILRRLRFRHLRLAPLGITLALSDLLFRLPFLNKSKHSQTEEIDWKSGLSIVIPHQRGTRMLEQCLVRLTLAAAHVKEPVEVIIVVNGSEQVDYHILQAQYADVRWLFFPVPLGFTRAVLKGIGIAKYGAIYLLNDDMLLDSKALVSVLSCRGPNTFAVASQIFFQDAGRRREETGWTSMTMVEGLPNPRHEVPVGSTIRGTVWAGAGSSMFNAVQLRRLMPDCLPYDPFYWEDVDLGVRAWRLGYCSVICPDSIVWHKHRATVEKYYAEEEVERVFERNRFLFQLRNPFPRQKLENSLQYLARSDQMTIKELSSWSSCRALWRMRWQAFKSPHRAIDYWTMASKIYSNQLRKIVVMVSPFVVLPPTHGGAVRTHRLATELAKDFEIILISDEADQYDDLDIENHPPFSYASLVEGRPLESVAGNPCRIARIQNHSHQHLKDELCRIVDLYRPAAVVVEHEELSEIINTLTTWQPKFILDLHDVLLCPGNPSQADADRLVLNLMNRFDGLVVSSIEDQELLGTPSSQIVPNGYDQDLLQTYIPSKGNRSLLFMGPFRAAINWQGIRDFVQNVYPEISASVPGVSLTILGGKGSLKMAASCRGFAQPSIRILEYVADPIPLLQQCALTINPQAELRGSSVKVIESLAVGRVCVSTVAGARGRLEQEFASLIAVECLEDFATPIIRLLSDEEARLALEVPEREKLKHTTWEAAGSEIRAYVKDIIERPTVKTRLPHVSE